MKTYRGIRDPGCRVLVLPADGGSAVDSNGAASYELTVPADLLTRPAGPFEWGGGAETPGTHYLAIALLADLLGPADRTGIRALLPFVRRFLARLPQDGFEISDTVFFALFSAIAVAGRADAPAANGLRAAGERHPVQGS